MRKIYVLGIVLVLSLATVGVASAVIQTLNSQTGQTQTFSNDSNVTVTSMSNTHSLGWSGVLPISRGGTGTSTVFTVGSVVFADAFGKYSQDNANLFWDDGADSLVIGDLLSIKTFKPAGSPTSTIIKIADQTIANESGSFLFIKGSDNSLGGVPGDIEVRGGDATGGGDVTGGNLYMVAGGGGGNAFGGEIAFYTGGSGTGGNGGPITLSTAPGNNNGGDIILELGQTTGSGRNGRVRIFSSATTTIEFGEIGDTSSRACFNTKNTEGDDISFYFSGTQMVIDPNPCQ